MKARFIAALVLLAVFGCNTSLELGPMPKLVPPEWQDGEVSTYTVSHYDTARYQYTLALAFDEQAAPGLGDTPPVPTLVVTSITEPLGDEDYFFDSAVVTCRRDSLRPLRSERRIETGIAEFEISARYDRGKVSITKVTVDGINEDVLALPPRTYSTDAIQTFLRAVPPDPGSSFRFNLCIPMEFRTVPVRVQVLGTKLVTTPLGDIMCRELSVLSPGRDVRYWYELAEPRRFVGTYDAQTEIRTVLTTWQAAAIDTFPALDTLP